MQPEPNRTMSSLSPSHRSPKIVGKIKYLRFQFQGCPYHFLLDFTLSKWECWFTYLMESSHLEPASP
jgi:hypothetical protein